MTLAPPSLRRSFSWTFAGNFVYAACLWGMLSLLTKMGSADTVGRFNLGSIIATPIIMFANLQLRSVLATDADDNYRLQDYLGVRLLALPVALVVVLVVAVLGYQREQIIVIMLFACARGVESLSDLFHGYAQKHERLDLVAQSLIIKGVASLAVFGAVFAATQELVWAMLGLVASWMVPLLVFDLPRWRQLVATQPLDRLRPSWHWPKLASLVWLALPMGLVMLLIHLRNTIPRTILEREFGEAELGIFAALAYLVIIGTTVVRALSQATLARLAVYYREGNRRLFRHTMRKLLGVGLGLGAAGVLGAYLVGRPGLTLIYNAQYGARSDLLVLIMAAGGLSYVATMLGGPATAMRAFRGQLFVHLANVVLLVFLSRMLIPTRGAEGAAWVMMGGAAWTALGYGFIVWHNYRRLPQDTANGGRT